ncbi:MAG: 30S ribosomal protein S21 [Paracoccus denitrificans]|nr:MAG: 30S ribosomal protein S21 [Paracoccus denitrificans]PZO83566.1 MAG: 30S ribosomal protein S21 [Paracoccus denitrificans]
MFKGLGGFGDMAKMMSAAKEMQGRMTEMQASLEKVTVTGEAGAGLVRATMTAKGDLTAVEIDPSIFVASEKQVVEDLIVAAINDARRLADTRARDEMARISRELGLPADMQNMPF